MENIANELHKPARKPTTFRQVISVYSNDIWSADLVEMKGFEKDNDNYKYILNVIDIFSRYVWSVPLKNKTGKTVADALKTIIQTTGKKPKHFWVDRGREFYNSNVDSVLKNVIFYSTYGVAKAAIIERFNRTMKARMYKIFTAKQTHRWIDILQQIVKKYNNTKHSSIGYSPHQVYMQGQEPIKQAETTNETRPKYKIGDRVRISYQRRPVFDKSYFPQWTYEIFIISKVIKSNPYTYKIKDVQGDEIEGSFYEAELQTTQQKDDVYLVEEVLQKKTIRGKKMVLIKWLGYKDPSWIPESDLGDFSLLD